MCVRTPCTYSRYPSVFSGNYSETATRNLDEDIVDEDAIAENYDYGSDSDLEDAEDLKATEKPPRGHPFDPLCFGLASDENYSLESNGGGTAGSNGPQDATRYFQPALHIGFFFSSSYVKQQ